MANLLTFDEAASVYPERAKTIAKLSGKARERKRRQFRESVSLDALIMGGCCCANCTAFVQWHVVTNGPVCLRFSENGAFQKTTGETVCLEHNEIVS